MTFPASRLSTASSDFPPVAAPLADQYLNTLVTDTLRCDSKSLKIPSVLRSGRARVPRYSESSGSMKLGWHEAYGEPRKRASRRLTNGRRAEGVDEGPERVMYSFESKSSWRCCRTKLACGACEY
jgi:hypothetical protein